MWANDLKILMKCMACMRIDHMLLISLSTLPSTKMVNSTMIKWSKTCLNHVQGKVIMAMILLECLQPKVSNLMPTSNQAT